MALPAPAAIFYRPAWVLSRQRSLLEIILALYGLSEAIAGTAAPSLIVRYNICANSMWQIRGPAPGLPDQGESIPMLVRYRYLCSVDIGLDRTP